MNGIGWAVKQLQDGQRVGRSGWNGRGMWLQLVPGMTEGYIKWPKEPKFPGDSIMQDSREVLPWIGMKTVDHKFVPWLASQTDLLATDWELA